MSVEDEKQWDIAFRGMQRFFDEGMVVWTKDRFFLLFSDENVASGKYVMDKVRGLDRTGAISFVGKDDFYIKVNDI